MKNKLSSRKFLLAVGGSATGIATMISGISVPNEKAMVACTVIGGVMTAVSIVAYNFAEAYVDGKAAGANTTNTSTQIKADTIGSGATERVINAVLPEPPKATEQTQGEAQ